MNTIIFHPFNRVKSTPAHDISAALIAPVSKWYRKPTPWWIDGFEEVGLQPIVEADEIAEEEEYAIEDQEEELGASDDEDEEADVASEPTCKDVIFEDFQGDEEGEQNSLDEIDVRQDAALEDIVFDDDPSGIDEDRRDDPMVVDEVSLPESDGDETLTNVTIDKDSTIILQVHLVDEHEWDEKAMLNSIIVEGDPENEVGDATNWSNSPALVQRESNNPNGVVPEHRGLEAWPGKLGSETRWVTTCTACQWLVGSLDGSGYDPNKACPQLPDDLAVKVADVVGYPLAPAVVKHDIGCGSARAFSVGDAKYHLLSDNGTRHSFRGVTSFWTDVQIGLQPVGS
ncbi:hypothetical protein F5887DRAFT_1281203 [Amanita rubescens]|nr:hypothetical protein F5887DRAFT_1281203 [Amanita rubescens]